MSSLLKEISELEKIHKQNSTSENLIRLTDKVQPLLNEQILRLRDKSHVLLYQYGNKLSRLLAGALRQRAPMTSILKIQKLSGEMIHDPKGILKTFHSFYSRLHSKPTNGNGSVNILTKSTSVYMGNSNTYFA